MLPILICAFLFGMVGDMLGGPIGAGIGVFVGAGIALWDEASQRNAGRK